MAFVTKKTSIHRILRDEDQSKPLNKRPPALLEEAVRTTHRIIFHATHLMNLAYLCQEEGTEPPPPDRKMITLATQVVSTTSRNTEIAHPLLENLTRFYQTHYLPTMLEDIPSRDNITCILEYERETLETAVKNNIVSQYQKRLCECINTYFDKKKRIETIKSDKTLTPNQKKFQQANFIKLLKQIKDDVSSKDLVLTAPEQYHPVILQIRQSFVPNRFVKSMKDDVERRPLSYFGCFLRLHRYLGGKFRLLPLRGENAPKYITLDTRVLKTLFKVKVKKVKGQDYDLAVWSQVFRMEMKDFRKKDKPFHYRLLTDGVGASLCFHNPNFVDDSNSETNPRNYVEQMEMEDKTIVAIDPNKEDLLYCVGLPVKDGSETPVDLDHLKTFRFTKAQKNFETKSRKYRKARRYGSKVKSVVVNGVSYSIESLETVLSKVTTKTADPRVFHNYLLSKVPISNYLSDHYAQPVHRKRRWYTYINTQKCEAKLIKNFAKTYGSPGTVVVCFGNYGQTALKGCEPVKGKAYRKLFANNGYTVKLVDEYNTSKLCHCCHGELEKFHHRKSQKPKTLGKQIEVHGLLRCPTCPVNRSWKTSDSKVESPVLKYRFWNRDLNAAKNIYRIATDMLDHGVRPEYLRRENDKSRGFDDISSTLNGVLPVFALPRVEGRL